MRGRQRFTASDKREGQSETNEARVLNSGARVESDRFPFPFSPMRNFSRRTLISPSLTCDGSRSVSLFLNRGDSCKSNLAMLKRRLRIQIALPPDASTPSMG